MDHQNYDADIIDGFKQGNDDAFIQVYQLHYNPLRYFADQLITNQQEARDIVADSFIKLFQRRNNFETLLGIRSFLYTTTRNACIDYHRSRKRNAGAVKEIEYLYAENEAELFFRSEIKAGVLNEIYNEIENLPPQCKKVFTLMFFKGMTSTEVAYELDISVKTVQNQKLKAIQLLRVALLKKNISALTLMYVLFLASQSDFPQSLN